MQISFGFGVNFSDCVVGLFIYQLWLGGASDLPKVILLVCWKPRLITYNFEIHTQTCTHRKFKRVHRKIKSKVTFDIRHL